MMHLLMMSTVLSVKFLVDVGDVDMAQVAWIAGTTLDAILQLEKFFLQTIDYRLFVSDRELEDCLHSPASARS